MIIIVLKINNNILIITMGKILFIDEKNSILTIKTYIN